MSAGFPHHPFEPSTLSAEQTEALTDALYAVQQRIFAGVDREHFRRYVIESPARRTRLQIFRDEAGQIIGYAAVHLFAVVLQGRTATVMRCEMGMLPEHRGQSLGWRLLAAEIASLMVTRPLQARFLVACPVHPASYFALARITHALHPRPEATPASLQRLFAALDTSLGLTRPAGAGEHVRAVGWITRQSAAEAAYWRQHESPLVQFFLRENPRYTRGDGFRIVIPLGPGGFVVGLARLLGMRLRRRLCCWSPAAETNIRRQLS